MLKLLFIFECFFIMLVSDAHRKGRMEEDDLAYAIFSYQNYYDAMQLRMDNSSTQASVISTKYPFSHGNRLYHWSEESFRFDPRFQKGTEACVSTINGDPFYDKVFSLSFPTISLQIRFDDQNKPDKAYFFCENNEVCAWTGGCFTLPGIIVFTGFVMFYASKRVGITRHSRVSVSILTTAFCMFLYYLMFRCKTIKRLRLFVFLLGWKLGKMRKNAWKWVKLQYTKLQIRLKRKKRTFPLRSVPNNGLLAVLRKMDSGSFSRMRRTSRLIRDFTLINRTAFKFDLRSIRLNLWRNEDNGRNYCVITFYVDGKRHQRQLALPANFSTALEPIYGHRLRELTIVSDLSFVQTRDVIVDIIHVLYEDFEKESFDEKLLPSITIIFGDTYAEYDPGRGWTADNVF